MFGKIDLTVKKISCSNTTKNSCSKKANYFYVFKTYLDREFEPIKINAKEYLLISMKYLRGLQENDEVINNALFLLDSDAITNSLY